ncbi:MAG: hypothetical protein AAGB14_13285 [Verrucomicrobiota bacterium]
MLGSLISAAAMSLTMYLIARHEAEMSLPITFLIAFGVSFTTAILSIFLGPLALIVGFAGAAWATHQFCYLRWPHAFITASVFVVVQFGLALVFSR